jgi:hypothetical protein
VKVTNSRGWEATVSGTLLPPLSPAGQELVGVGPVGGRTGGAARLPPGAARLEQHPIGLPVGVVDSADLAALPVGLPDAAGEADRVVAVAGLGDQLGPPRIAMPGPLDQFPDDAGQQLPHPHRLTHAASPGAGISGTTRSPGACPASTSAGSPTPSR